MRPASGSLAASSGLFSLAATASLTVGGTAYVGSTGTGTFIQSGGTASFNGADNNGNSISIGDQAGAQGAYSLSFGNLTASQNETVGNKGTGTFTQTGGTNTVDGSLFLGSATGGSGAYSLSAFGLLSVTGSENIGDSGSPTTPGGTGVFTQSGGANDLAGTLFVGSYPSDHGTYTLQGGTFAITSSTGGESIGNGGTAVFNQTSGENTLVSGANLDIANIGGSGTYSLSGTGSLNVASNAYVGGGATSSGGTGLLSVSGNADLSILGTLKIWNSSSTQMIISGGTVTAGNTINLATITQTGGTSHLGALSGTGNVSVGSASGSSTTMNVVSLQQNAVIINSTGTLVVGDTAPGAVNSLQINGNGKLDLTGGSLIINYGSGTDPVSTIRSYLISGRNGGAWTGPGIDSSTAALSANNAHYGVGYADSADSGNPAHLSTGQIEIKYTLLGDANLDGIVSGDDFTILVGNLGKSAAAWDEGDFNYDGIVSGDDFTELVGNLGKESNGGAIVLPASDYAAIDAFAAANGLLADVPEPASGGLLLATGFGLMARRRRNARIQSFS